LFFKAFFRCLRALCFCEHKEYLTTVLAADQFL
jgi:hypothetical protein